MLDYRTIFGWKFKKSKPVETNIKAPFIKKNDEEAGFVVGHTGAGQQVYELSIDQKFKNENEIIKKYRGMALHPEVDAAITEVVNESISGEVDEYPVSIILDDIEGLSENIKDKIREEFKHIMKLLDFNNKSYEIFRKWYVDGRLYYYMIPDKTTSNGLVELRYMSPLWTKKVKSETEKHEGNGAIVTDTVEEYFIYQPTYQQNTGQGIKLTKDSVAYITSGLYDEVTQNTFSYLHKAIRPVNQLRMLEDATVIYRLSRAPERRIFYIDCTNLPRGKADEYMKSVRASLSNKMVYDQASGELKDQKENLSMLEDIWLPRVEGGATTEVENLQGGQNLGEIEDIEYFKRIVYMALDVPYSRLAVENQAGFSLGRASEITRDELKFSKFVQRLRKKFSQLFLVTLKTQLLLKKIITEDDWETLEEGIRFDYITDNYFKELKDSEILRERLATLEQIGHDPASYFSREYIKRNVLMMTDEEIEEMDKQLEDEEPEEDDVGDEGMEEPEEKPNGAIPGKFVPDSADNEE